MVIFTNFSIYCHDFFIKNLWEVRNEKNFNKKILPVIAEGLVIQSAFACTALEIQAKDGSGWRKKQWSGPIIWIWNFLFYPQKSSFQLLTPTANNKPTTVVASTL